MSTVLSSSPVYYSSYDLPFGPVSVASTAKGICACFIGANSLAALLAWLENHFNAGSIEHSPDANRHIEVQLREYFSGKRKEFDLTYDLLGTAFQVRVWQELQKIPYGQTITYGELARRVGGGPQYSRAVGGANNKNPIGIIIPCHRVIGRDGKLVGYAGGLETKNKLLQLENGCFSLLD